jgi:hypothetical protein
MKKKKKTDPRDGGLYTGGSSVVFVATMTIMMIMITLWVPQ